MSITNKRNQVVHTIQDISHKTGSFISDAVARIFGLHDDDYPKTGVQPFDGDTTSKK